MILIDVKCYLYSYLTTLTVPCRMKTPAQGQPLITDQFRRIHTALVRLKVDVQLFGRIPELQAVSLAWRRCFHKMYANNKHSLNKGFITNEMLYLLKIRAEPDEAIQKDVHQALLSFNQFIGDFPRALTHKITPQDEQRVDPRILTIPPDVPYECREHRMICDIENGIFYRQEFLNGVPQFHASSI
jgi:hypothetical protein